MSSPLPPRAGQPWLDDEVIKLLTAIRQKKNISEIASLHQRTVTGIQSRLHVLAVDYYFNDQKSIEQIMKITGLDEVTILDKIKKRENAEKFREIKKELKSQKAAATIESTKDSSSLNDLHKTLQIILTKLESIESDVEELKRNSRHSSVADDEDLLLFTSDLPVQNNDYMF
jgi:hypothetical protein